MAEEVALRTKARLGQPGFRWHASRPQVRALGVWASQQHAPMRPCGRVLFLWLQGAFFFGQRCRGLAPVGGGGAGTPAPFALLSIKGHAPSVQVGSRATALARPCACRLQPRGTWCFGCQGFTGARTPQAWLCTAAQDPSAPMCMVLLPTAAHLPTCAGVQAGLCRGAAARPSAASVGCTGQQWWRCAQYMLREPGHALSRRLALPTLRAFASAHRWGCMRRHISDLSHRSHPPTQPPQFPTQHQ